MTSDAFRLPKASDFPSGTEFVVKEFDVPLVWIPGQGWFNWYGGKPRPYDPSFLKVDNNWPAESFEAWVEIVEASLNEALTTPPSTSPFPFDARVTLETPLRLFAPWLAAVLLVTWAGYPGVVCVTPLAWLLALRVGLRCAVVSRSPKSSQRMLEAALAGGFFGFLQGVLFLLIAPRMGPISSSEQGSALGIGLFLMCGGMFTAAGLSAFNAWLFLRRRTVPITG